MAQFIGIIHKDKTSDFGVSFPDFLGCVTAGSTMQEAYLMAQEALQAHIDVCAEYHEYIPSRSMTLDDVAAHELAKNAVAFINVSARLPGRTRRINISLDEEIIQDIDAVSNNRSAFLAQAARDKLQQAPHP